MRTTTISSNAYEFASEPYLGYTLSVARHLPDGLWSIKIMMYAFVVSSSYIYATSDAAFDAGRKVVDAIRSTDLVLCLKDD